MEEVEEVLGKGEEVGRRRRQEEDGARRRRLFYPEHTGKRTHLMCGEVMLLENTREYN